MELNYKSFGSGEPVIILHGLFGMLDNWQTMAKRLAKDFTVFTVDQRNHGRSPHMDDISYPLMAEDLLLFMEHHWIYNAHIIGHSMGGKTAMQFALDHSDMVNKLVVVDMAPKVSRGHHDLVFDALLGIDLKTLDSRTTAAQLVSEKVSDISVVRFLLKNLTRDKAGQYRWKMNLPVILKEYKKILAAISGNEPVDNKTLFVKGGTSDYIGDSDMPEINALFPNARLTVVESAGHWVHAESPDELYALLTDFLR